MVFHLNWDICAYVNHFKSHQNMERNFAHHFHQQFVALFRWLCFSHATVFFQHHHLKQRGSTDRNFETISVSDRIRFTVRIIIMYILYTPLWSLWTNIPQHETLRAKNRMTCWLLAASSKPCTPASPRTRFSSAWGERIFSQLDMGDMARTTYPNAGRFFASRWCRSWKIDK